MDQTTEYGIVYLLPGSAANYHLDLWTQIEREFHLTGNAQPNTPAHITVKYHFSAENVEEVERILEAFAGATQRTPWSVRGFNRFLDADNYVIFLDVIPSDAARRSHADLLDWLRSVASMEWGRFDGVDLHYHATVANKGLTGDNFEAVWSFVNSQEAPDFDLYFDNLALLKIIGDAHTVYRTFRLLSDTPPEPATTSSPS